MHFCHKKVISSRKSLIERWSNSLAEFDDKKQKLLQKLKDEYKNFVDTNTAGQQVEKLRGQENPITQKLMQG